MKNDIRAVNMSFGAALNILKNGGKIARTGWNGKGMWVDLQVPDEHSKMTEPYMYLNYPADTLTPNGRRVPWVPSVTDVLADDWYTASTPKGRVETIVNNDLPENFVYRGVATAMYVIGEDVIAASSVFSADAADQTTVDRAKRRVMDQLNGVIRGKVHE